MPRRFAALLAVLALLGPVSATLQAQAPLAPLASAAVEDGPYVFWEGGKAFRGLPDGSRIPL